MMSVNALAAFVPGLNFNPVAGAGYAAAAIAAYTAAGIIRAIPMKEGGEFTVPGGYPNDRFMAPLALTSGEKVTVEPAGRKRPAQQMVVVNQYIEGSVWTTRDLGDLARSAVRMRR
jgi:hypothetical protein